MWDRSTGPVSHTGQSQSCRYERVELRHLKSRGKSPDFSHQKCFVPQVAGHSDGLTLMENADPLLLLVSLPLVPLGLVLGKMVSVLKR